MDNEYGKNKNIQILIMYIYKKKNKKQGYGSLIWKNKKH